MYPMQLKSLFERHPDQADEPVPHVSVSIERLLIVDHHICQAPRSATAGILLDLDNLGLDWVADSLEVAEALKVAEASQGRWGQW